MLLETALMRGVAHGQSHRLEAVDSIRARPNLDWPATMKPHFGDEGRARPRQFRASVEHEVTETVEHRASAIPRDTLWHVRVVADHEVDTEAHDLVHEVARLL